MIWKPRTPHPQGQAQLSCLMIAPIGEVGSETRRRSDKILNHIVRPVCTESNLIVVRADEIAKPGIISSQIIDRLVSDDLVIADLTEGNPNVYYELAVRHASRKPVVPLIEKGEKLPFDVAGTRTIVVDHRDLDSVEEAKYLLREYIGGLFSADANADAGESPISLAIDLKGLRGSQDPQQAGLADVVQRMSSMHTSIAEIERQLDSNLIRRLDRLTALAVSIDQRVPKPEATSESMAALNDKVSDLRERLTAAVDRMITDVADEHLRLAERIQDVFEDQSRLSSETVAQKFSQIMTEKGLAGEKNGVSVVADLTQAFMHGMSTMGKYQRINIESQTSASTTKIEQEIKKSIEDIFGAIDDIEEKIGVLPPVTSVTPTPSLAAPFKD